MFLIRENEQVLEYITRWSGSYWSLSKWFLLTLSGIYIAKLRKIIEFKIWNLSWHPEKIPSLLNLLNCYMPKSSKKRSYDVNINKWKIPCCLKNLVSGSKDHKRDEKKGMSEQNEKGFHLNHPTSPMKTYTRLISLQGSVSFKSISQRQRLNTKCNSSY